MNKYSIVIPTLWKSNRIGKLLFDLIKCEFVDEIILIDNGDKFFEYFEALDKVKLVQPEENIYVNPAWNLGVKLAKNNSIALVNDDINFNPNIFGVITNDILLEYGIIGQSEYNYKGNNTDEPILEKWSGKIRDWGWGCLILFDKKNWMDIPDDIKIWYGDDYIFKCNTCTKSIMKNFNIETEMSTTSDEPIWNERKKQDYNNFINYLQNESAR